MPPRVFISYSHDSRAHCDAVLALAQQLRRDGIAAELDQFHQEELLHWPRWCEEQMRPENADFVLCVCTAEYARRVEGRVAADVGKGVFWEGTLIYNELYDAKGNPRCVPVLLDGGSDADIPRILRNWTWFRLDALGLADDGSNYAKLWRLLMGQASITPAALGALPVLARKTDFVGLIAQKLDAIKDDTQTILANQAAHQALLNRITDSARTYRPAALHQLKSPPEHFTGRAEALAQVCATLRQGETVAVSAVNGLGGIGKTALATMAAHAVRTDFPDIQLFIELRAHSPNPVPAEAARDGVLQAAHPEARLPEGEAARWALYRALFEGKRALVVLDDAADDAQVEALKPPPGSALLVTSRRQLRAGQALRLDKLPRAEAVDLLRAWAPRLTAAEAERLAGLCGDLPVALKTAGGYLKAYPSVPVGEYLEELAGHRLEGLRNDDLPWEDVNRVFEASFGKLTEAERRAWTALSVMTAGFGREAGKAVIEAHRPEAAPTAAKLLDKLVHLNLLDYGEQSGRFGWHDLLREFAAAHLDGDAAERARVAHAEYFIGIAEQTQALYEQGHDSMLQGLALFDQERAQLEAAFIFLAAAPRHDARLLKLVGGVAYTGYLRFAPPQHIRWQEAQLGAARRLGDKQYEGNALGHLGLIYADLGEPRKAIEYHDQYLAIAREIGDRRGEGNALGNLGIVYADLGEPRKAIEYYEQQLVIARDIGDRRGEGNALGNLGNVYRYLDEPREVIEYCEQDLAIRRDIGDRRGEGNALGNLGLAYADLGELRKAIECYEQQLVIARDIGDRRGEGNALWNSALAYEDLGERAEAIHRAEQALALYEAIEDPNAAKVRAALAEWRAEPGPEHSP